MMQASPKRFLARLLCLLLVGLLLLSALPIASFAAEYSNDSDIELDGTFTGTFELSSNRSQLFHLTNVAPGDSWSGTLHVKNSASAAMEFTILSVTSDLEDTVLFDALTTKISVHGETVYDSTYGFQSEGKTMIPYYAIAPGETLDVDITVLLPRTTGNKVMNKIMDSTWTFECRYYGSSYTVHYVDEYGNALAPRKTEFAPIGITVKENAIAIEGYKPDKSSKTLKIKDTDNEIIFVYTRMTEDDNPITGDNISGFTMSLLIMFLAAVAIMVSYVRARAIRKELRKKEKHPRA